MNGHDRLRVWACSSVGRAPGLQPGGQGFESPQVHQISLCLFSHLLGFFLSGLWGTRGHCAKNVMRQIAIELVVSALYGLPDLLDHAELIYTFRLGARVPHRLLDHTISRHLAHSGAKGVSQLIDREIRYACPLSVFFQAVFTLRTGLFWPSGSGRDTGSESLPVAPSTSLRLPTPACLKASVPRIPQS
jgi:hypothetical protein